MSVLTIEEVTNYFLYGAKHKPYELADEDLIDRVGGAAINNINPNEYMNEVWIDKIDSSKSIIKPSDFNVIAQFLGTASGAFQNGLSYSLDETLSILDLTDLDTQARLQLVDYFDGSREMLDQIYIWNSATFALHESITFKIDSNGVRTIENYAPVPESDNFDFRTADSILDIANFGNQLVLADNIDSFRIGRQVTINFNTSITQPDYFMDLWAVDLYTGRSPSGHLGQLFQFAGNAVAELVPDLTSEYSDPAVQMRNGRRMFYGTSVEIEQGDTVDDYLDPTSNIFITGINPKYYLGFHFLSGVGDDTMVGTTGSDYFEGGADNDTYIFDINNNIGSDFIDDQSGINHIVLDGLLPDKYINGMTITEVDPDTGVYYELDGNGEIVEGLKFVLADQLGGGSQLVIQLSESPFNGNGSITIKNFNAANYGLTLVAGDIDDFQPDAPTLTSGADVIGDGIISYTELKPRILSNLNSQARIYEAGQYDGNFDTQFTNIYDLGTKQFSGSNFNDILTGSFFNENPGYLEEYLIGFDGDDFIEGEDSTLAIGDNDLLVGGRGSDFIFGRGGDDIIYGNHDTSENYSFFSVSHDQNFKEVLLSDGSTTENFGDIDYIDGGAGDDSIHAGSGADFLVGGDGDDNIYGFAGGDFIQGDGGADHIYGDAYGLTDLGTLDVNAVLDYNYGAFSQFNDVILGGDGNDTIIGEYGDDVVEGGDGDDWLYGDDNPADIESFRRIDPELHGADIINGGQGNDHIFGRGGNDVLNGNSGDDQIAGGGGNDTIYGEDGADLIFGDDNDQESGGDDVIYGGAGNDYIGGDDNDVLLGGNDILYGGSGNDTIIGYGGSDSLYGGLGDDFLLGDTEGHASLSASENPNGDYLDGGEGADTLYGGEGDDELIGGKGVDALVGGAGWDSYIFSEGDGQLSSSGTAEVLVDSDIGLIQINAAVTSTTYQSAQNQILITYGSSDYLLVSAEGFNSVKNRVYDGVDIEFARYSTDFADGLVGDAGDNTVATDDVLTSSSNSHSIFLNDGDDLFTYTQGNGDLISVWGGAGDDVLDLQGSGYVGFEGGLGADTIMFGLGSSQHAFSMSQSTDSDDRILLKQGISFTDVEFQKTNNNLVISIIGSSSDQLTLADYFSTSTDQLSVIEFSDGTSFTKESMELLLDTANYLIGDSSANILEAPNSGGVLKGMGGDDTLIVDFINFYTPNPNATGDDIFYGGDGNDYFFSYYGNDMLYGEAGNDFINAGDGDDFLSGGDGDDDLYASYGNDTLSGGAGDDVMVGELGYDTYMWGEGYGNDQIFKWSYEPHEQNDELLIVGDLTSNDIDWSRSDSNLIGEIIDTQETITINGWFDGFTRVLDRITFESGGSIDGTALDMSLRFDVIEGSESAENLYGTSGEDLIFGLAGNDFLLGEGDNDWIYGGDGDDYLNGGDGDDVLLGGDGLDWYLFGGNGSDFLDVGVNTGTRTLYQNLSGGAGSDLYSFGANFGNASVDADGNYYAEDSIQFTEAGPEDLWFSQDTDDLIIDIVGTDNQIIVNNWFLDGNNKYKVTDIYTHGFVLSTFNVDDGIDALISAMASYDVPSGAGNVVPQAVKDALAPTIANVWQETDRRIVHYY